MVKFFRVAPEEAKPAGNAALIEQYLPETAPPRPALGLPGAEILFLLPPCAITMTNRKIDSPLVKLSLGILSVIVGVASSSANPPPEIAEPLRIIRAVGPEGRGNREASAAWKKLAESKAVMLLPILEAMDGANDYALNWLRAAFDAIASRELSSGAKLPLPELGKFLLDTRHNPRARRLAFELIGRNDPEHSFDLRWRDLLPQQLAPVENRKVVIASERRPSWPGFLLPRRDFFNGLPRPCVRDSERRFVSHESPGMSDDPSGWRTRFAVSASPGCGGGSQLYGSTHPRHRSGEARSALVENA